MEKEVIAKSHRLLFKMRPIFCFSSIRSVVYFSLDCFFSRSFNCDGRPTTLCSLCLPLYFAFCEIPFALPSASFHSINSSLICVLVSVCGGERRHYYCYFTACPSNCRLVGEDWVFIWTKFPPFELHSSDYEFCSLILPLNHQSAKDELIGSRNRLLLQPPHIVFCRDV